LRSRIGSLRSITGDKIASPRSRMLAGLLRPRARPGFCCFGMSILLVQIAEATMHCEPRIGSDTTTTSAARLDAARMRHAAADVQTAFARRGSIEAPGAADKIRVVTATSRSRAHARRVQP